MQIPLVLVSGLLSNETLWKHQTEHLRDIASIQVVSPNQETPEKMVQAVLESAPAKFALAGHSMGGWLCLEIMRVAAFRVSKLCLLNTTVRMDTEEKALRRREMIQRAQTDQFDDVVKMISEQFVDRSTVKKDVEKMFLEVGKEAFVNQEKAMIQRKESESILPTIACPTFVIHANQDRNFTLSEHEELVAQIHNAKLGVVEDSGHMSPMEMPQAVTALIRFWLSYF